MIKQIFAKAVGIFEVGIVRNEMENVIAKFRLHGDIIDYGCGQMPYKKLFRYAIFVGADIPNPTMPSKATVMINDYRTSLPSGYFDVAICNEVIEHVQEPDRVLKELSRLVRADGFLVLSAPFMMPEHDARDYWRFTLKGLKALAERHGFVVVHGKKLTRNFHSIGHMLGNAMMLTFAGQKGSIRYLTCIIVFPFMMMVRFMFFILDKMFMIDTGPMVNLIVCRKAKEK